MKTKHTPEPWGAGTEVYMSAKAGEIHGPAFVYPHGHHQDLCIANAQRIVACVNACAGIDNETLIHAGVVQRGELGDVIRQRDILLEALKELLIDVKISQNNMRDAEKTDSRWEGCADVIQPRVDSAQAALDFVNNVV